MSLQTDAETVRDLANKIVQAEIEKAKIVASGGVIFIGDNPDLPVTLTAGQKADALAVEVGWKATVKAITAAW